METKLKAKYGLFTAIAMVVGQVIGSGIFFKADDILVATEGNSFAGLMGFLIVGISVVFAAAAMANYAKVIPKDGGIIAYVDYRFGSRAAALVGWIYLSLFYPSLTAVVFTVSGIYITHFLAEFVNFNPNYIHYCLVGVINSFIFLLINVYRSKASGYFQQYTTVLKLLPLLLIASWGVITFTNNITTGTSSEIFPGIKMNENNNFWFLVASSFIPIAFAFDGWYVSTQISGEIKNPTKNLPKALIIGTSIVLLVYTFYYSGIVLNMDSKEIISLQDSYITEFARKLYSDTGALLIQVFVIISVLGTANGLLMANIRIPFQYHNLSKTKKFLNLNKIDAQTGMPVRSALFSYALLIIYFLIYYITNTVPFFKEKNFDLSALPVTIIYIINGALIFGLLKLAYQRIIEKNIILTSINVIVAISGIILVLIGTAVANNGIAYILISLLYIIIGLLLIKK